MECREEHTLEVGETSITLRMLELLLSCNTLVFRFTDSCCSGLDCPMECAVHTSRFDGGNRRGQDHSDTKKCPSARSQGDIQRAVVCTRKESISAGIWNNIIKKWRIDYNTASICYDRFFSTEIDSPVLAHSCK